MSDDFEQAKQYGIMITKRGKHVHAMRVRMFDGHYYNWSHHIVRGNVLYTPTDQTFDLEANYESELDYYDEVWFEGVLIYKKPWWKKLLG